MTQPGHRLSAIEVDVTVVVTVVVGLPTVEVERTVRVVLLVAVETVVWDAVVAAPVTVTTPPLPL